MIAVDHYTSSERSNSRLDAVFLVDSLNICGPFRINYEVASSVVYGGSDKGGYIGFLKKK